ncbi:Suppressor of Profilin deletion [Cladophialophora chaetospira]|uniref:Suppressor of Profilin deletion n=1 Tax=Cladophialophora chaetospira TaxID=386627 RepID=A0AA38XJ69_9EURO|nr:Suppressor of Profilin deletion [Cladophialophora chaetospira]
MANNDVPRTEYLNLLASLQPEQAVNILNDRVTLITKINGDIADWLQERRKVEDAYVAGLRKLARRPQQDGAAALGIFQMPWQRIVSGTENLAASHETLAMKIETDVETPLRSWATRNRGFKDLSTAQVSLGNIARELSGAQKKAAKGGRRADNASSTVEDASRQWESQAPYVFEQLQVVDETRVNHLRDVLTQFQTHEVDLVEKHKVSAESCLGALLNVETADEIKTFAARVATGGGPGQLRRLSSATASGRPTSSLRAPPTPPPPRGTTDGYSVRSNSFAAQDRLTPLPPPKEKSKLGGLKRLGTVINRRKSTMPLVPSSTEEKRRTRFVPFRRGDSSRSFQDLEESGQDLTPTPTQERPASSVSQPQRYEQPERDLPEPPLPNPQTNGVNQAPKPLESHPTGNSFQAGLPDTLSTPSAQTSNNPYQQMALNQAATANTNESITQAQQALSEASGFASPSADESARNFMIRDKPIEEDQTEAQQAMNEMANQLRSQAQNAGINRPQGSVRGRRDVRNTMYIPSSTEVLPQTLRAAPPVVIPEDVTTPENTLASPLQRPPPIAVLQDDHIGSDTASMTSSRSLAGPTLHSELHDPGLSASVIETVHSTFTETGISKSFVLGEIALAYNPSGPSITDSETIRIQHFELLDKVAANPIFLSQIKPTGDQTEEQAGSYKVTTTQLRRPNPMICLKYQLHMEESNLARYSPILLSPAWQVVDGQVSVIVLYSLNPIFGSEAISLKNVTINVGLDISDPSTPRAQSAMMAPTAGASFRRKTSSVVWRLPEFVVKPEQDRLLVRFITAGVAKQGAVDIKFEIPGRTASGVGVERLVESARESDPFADGAEDGEGVKKGWDVVPGRMKVVSGKYTAS